MRLLVIAVVAFALWALGVPLGSLLGEGAAPSPEADSPAASWRSEEPGAAGAGSRGTDPGERAVLDAYAAGRSGVLVEVSGVVEKTLRDDNRGSRHQLFLLALDSGHTLLVSHNVDLAPRLDGLRRGDALNLRGEYEWNERGGIVHWTHHDPDGRHPGGWIEHAGRRYE